MSVEPTSVDLAMAELAESMIPHPDQFLEDYSPPAALLFGRQVAMVCLKIAAGAAASLDVDRDEEQPVLSKVLNGVAAAVAGFTHALVALEVLPVEAEEALAAGMATDG